MKTIAGFATFMVGSVVAIYGLAQTNYLFIGIGLVVAYTGIRVLKSKPN